MNRKVEETLIGFSTSIAVSRGCPQWGVSSHFLWCLVGGALKARLSGGGIHIQGYADDTGLLAVGKFPNTMSGLMQ